MISSTLTWPVDHPEVAFQPRRPQLAGNFHPAVNPDVAELVVHDLEVVGRHVDVHVADLPLVRPRDRPSPTARCRGCRAP